MREIFQDESGSFSSARCLLWLWSAVTLWAVAFDALHSGDPVSNAAWATLSGVEVALIAWAGGPRIAQYLGPTVGQVAAGVAAAVRERLPSRDDDERDA